MGSVKRLIERIAPPILVDIYRRKRLGHIWEGVYQHYQNVPVAGRGFDGDVWVTSMRVRAERLLAASREGPIPVGKIDNQILLPLLASVMCKNLGRVRILDFGGGMGVTYLYVISSLVECDSIDYHIVETESICEAGARLFETDGRIHFHTRLPDDLLVDGVLMNNTLQYIEDYKGLINNLTDYNPVYFLYGVLPAGDVPTYASAQRNVKGSSIPCWFFSIDEIVDIMGAKGYDLIFKGVSEQVHDQGNFPAEYRQENRCHLLFAKT